MAKHFLVNAIQYGELILHDLPKDNEAVEILELSKNAKEKSYAEEQERARRMVATDVSDFLKKSNCDGGDSVFEVAIYRVRSSN